MRSFFTTALGLAAAANALFIPAFDDFHYDFETVTGYFLQDDNATDPSTFDYATVNFGLLNRTYPTDKISKKFGAETQWQRFAAHLLALNLQAPFGTTYKILFLGRHGQGYHNAAESYYGTPAWNCYWGLRDGNGTVTWADARVTPEGAAQSQKAHNYWASRISEQKMPTPERFYTSPLTRCLQTANQTFSGLNLNLGRPFVPEVKEFFREGVSPRTCDHRGSRTYIKETFPGYTFEQGFNETDPLWQPLKDEGSLNQAARTYAVLNQVFAENVGKQWISVTSHSGEIRTILSVLGHRTFSLSTGQVIPVLVKAKRAQGKKALPTEPYANFTGVCDSPPALPGTKA